MTSYVNDEIILEVIQKSLSCLGESPKQAIWFCLKKEFNLDEQKIPENLEAFQQALQRYFGLGYNFLDTLMRKYLGDIVGEDLNDYPSFAESVAVLRLKKND